MIPSLFWHLDWTKIAEGILTSAGGGYGLLVLGRRTQKWRETTDTRTADQKNIDQFQKNIDQLIGRVGKLETDMTVANSKIEDLRNEKMELQVQIVSLRQQIALLEIKKAEFESRESIFIAHVRDLEDRLMIKTEELRCAEAKLQEMEEEKDAAV